MSKEQILKPSKEIAPLIDTAEGQKSSSFVKPSLQPIAIEPSPFGMVRQGTAVSEIMRQNVTAAEIEAAVDPVSGKAVIGSGGVMQLSFIDFDKLTRLTWTTRRLFIALNSVFTAEGSQYKTVRLPLREYMEMCDLKNEKETRRQVKRDLTSLRKTAFTFTDTTSYNRKNFLDVSILQDGGIWNSIIVATWSDKLFSLLKDYPRMYFHELFYRLDASNKHAAALFWKIQTHKRINAGEATENRLSVKKLLDACPELPTYEQVMKGNRNLTDRIIKPFEDNLDALEEALTWEYCHSGGAPLTDEELQNFTYDLFITLLVQFHWKEYPDQSKLIEGKAKGTKIAKRRKAAKKEEGKQ